jgi:outer membrane protein assembly factor BamB
VRLTPVVLATAVGMVVLLWTAVGPVAVAASPSAAVRILFDLGDGTYVWADETIADPEAPNATWNAVQHGASANGIVMESELFDWGVGVLDLADRNPPAGFVGLFEWNATSEAWGLALVGISSLVLQDGDAIALSNAAFAAVPPYPVRTPVPTPANPRPSTAFRGDLSNSGLAGSPAPSRVRLLWDRDTGTREVGSTPAVANGRLFVSTMTGMVALDARTGEVLWTKPYGRGFSSPTVFDDSVYVGTSNGTVVRLDADDGNLRWETRLLASTSFTGISSAPKVAFDSLYVGTFNESGGPGEVVALWEGNGTVRWRYSTASIHFSSPAYQDGVVYVGVMGRYNVTNQISFDPPYGVLALGAATGLQRWFAETQGSVAASPAILGESIVAPAKDGTVYALDRTTGDVLWESEVGAGVSSPAVVGDTVYVGGGTFAASGRVVALDAADGSEKWSFTPNGPVQASITYAGGRVVFATNTDHGTIYALDATNGAPAWSYEPLPSQYILGSPVVADGVVYAPSDNGHVVALSQGAVEAVPVQAAPVPLGVLEVGSIAAAATVIAVVAWILIRWGRRDGV